MHTVPKQLALSLTWYPGGENRGFPRVLELLSVTLIIFYR